jgi:hypothetical protein
MRIPRFFSIGMAVLAVAATGQAKDHTVHTFKKIQITDKFWAEGANFGDFNHDGKVDVVCGPYWYEGPDFKVRHEYYPAKQTFKLKKADGTEETIEGFEGGLGVNNTYSDNFFAFTYDFNHDGWDDILILGFPGQDASWYENPRGKKAADGTEHWVRHKVFDVVDDESPTFVDVNGDGKPEIVCCSGGYVGYVTVDWEDATRPWKFHAVSPKVDVQKFTHGIGYGDVNGDGRTDLLMPDGWWEQPASLAGDPVWKFHPFKFSDGGSQMFAYDVNGDGKNDVITTLEAHGYGLVWWEQTSVNGEISFTKHVILGREAKDNKYGVVFSQPHAVDLVDMDGDGLKDIVTGKRFWAHGSHGDADPHGTPYLYWFKLVRGPDHSVDWVPYMVDDNSGVGTQVVAGRGSNKKYPDIVVGNKKGAFVFLHETRKVSEDEWKSLQPKPIQP